MIELLQLVIAVGATKLGSDAWEALVTEGGSLGLQKIQDALKGASAQADTAAAVRRAEACLQSRPSTEVRALLNEIDPSKCQSVYNAVRELEDDSDGTRLRAQLEQSFTLCSPQGTSTAIIADAVEAFYVAVLEALYVSESPLRAHAELLYHKWQHDQTRAAATANRGSERARATIARIRQYKDAGQTPAAEALVRDLDDDHAIASDRVLRAELLTLNAGLLEARGRRSDAASKLLEASRLAPHSDITRTNKFSALELLGQEQQAASIAQQLRQQHPYCPKCYVAYLTFARRLQTIGVPNSPTCLWNSRWTGAFQQP